MTQGYTLVFETFEKDTKAETYVDAEDLLDAIDKSVAVARRRISHNIHGTYVLVQPGGEKLAMLDYFKRAGIVGRGLTG